jgi:hypothetical protein
VKSTPDIVKSITRDNKNGAEREDTVSALRDTLQLYHEQLDEPIGDHTGDGTHPERPGTAQE